MALVTKTVAVTVTLHTYTVNQIPLEYLACFKDDQFDWINWMVSSCSREREKKKNIDYFVGFYPSIHS